MADLPFRLEDIRTLKDGDFLRLATEAARYPSFTSATYIRTLRRYCPDRTEAAMISSLLDNVSDFPQH